MTDAARLDRLESVEAIGQLVARYALATDSCGRDARSRDALRTSSAAGTSSGTARSWGRRPLGLAPANWPEHHTGRGELPEAWESWPEFWGP
jgi:hypothetical protein